MLKFLCRGFRGLGLTRNFAFCGYAKAIPTFQHTHCSFHPQVE